MENLSDDLLMEIWSRVPYKMAVSCKSISKRFSALLSHHQFIQRSILHHHTMLQHKDCEKEWHLNFISKRKLLIFFFPNLHLSNPQNQISLKRMRQDNGIERSKMVSCPKGFSFTQSTVLLPVVAHEGRLYFSGKNSLLVYDPFNNDEQCDVISYPSGTSPEDIVFNGHVGVCCGNIRISSVYLYDSILGVSVKVWELEKESSIIGWRLLHVIGLPRQPVRDCIKEELLTGREGEIIDMGMQVRAFHPYHGDVVFFQRAHRMFVGNLKTNRFETVGYGIHGFYSLQMFSLHLPFWPTPVPSIT